MIPDVPYAIGVDIGCGGQVARTNLVWDDSFDPRKLRAVLRQIQRDVPTGFTVHKQPPVRLDRLIDRMGVDPPTVIQHGWPLREIRLEHATLEEFFVQVTANQAMGKTEGGAA